jgi:alpha-soluble NSF attachment protein
MAEPNEKKGDEYMEKAEKALNKWSLFSGNSKYEEAAELFERAANSYKVGKSSLSNLF